jgi:predicted peptidase
MLLTFVRFGVTIYTTIAAIWEFLIMETLKYKELEYIIRYPVDFSKDKKYPLVIYLHGAGGRGRDLESLKKYHGFFAETADVLRDSVSVLPQCYANSWFDIFEQLEDYAEMVASLPFVDSQRVYLLGARMGGYGAWQLAMSRPELFAAVAPICGGGMYWNAARLKNTPVWAFHGDSDQTVLPEESRKMVDGVNKNGGDARLTIYENTEHNAWSPTFVNAEFWKWMLSQENHYAPTKNEYGDVKKYG